MITNSFLILIYKNWLVKCKSDFYRIEKFKSTKVIFINIKLIYLEFIQNTIGLYEKFKNNYTLIF